MTTTSSGAGAVEEWFSWWLADWRMDVKLTDLTQGLAAVNLAGPRAREILTGLTELDCSPEAFKYLDAKHAERRRRALPDPADRVRRRGRLRDPLRGRLRRARVGRADRRRAAAHGIKPFGLEPQRILRLQKMHILVGQDTDSESTPFGAAMPWIVKLDKEADFIGKWALEHYAEEEPATRLVGFTLGNGYVPTEGAVIVDAVGDAGRPGDQRALLARARPGDRDGLGAESAGSRRRAGDDLRRGAHAAAHIQTRPFYDPDGEVLRS